MKVAKNMLNIVIFLLRFILKLLIIYLKRQGVNTLKLRGKNKAYYKVAVWFIIEVVGKTWVS